MTKQTTTAEKWANLPVAVKQQLATIDPKKDLFNELERVKNELHALSYSLDYNYITGEITDVYRVEVITFGSFGNTLGRPVNYVLKYVNCWGFVQQKTGVLNHGEVFSITQSGNKLILDLR
jgi:hypothetical protein